jgi:prevent-host-death family protein
MRSNVTTIPHRRLRNESGKILREAERGHQFVVTVDGRPVAIVGPAEPDAFVTVARAREALAGTPVDPRFRRDARRAAGYVRRFDPWNR